MNVRKHPNILEQQTNQSAGGSGTTAWGLVTGTLSDQTDLQSALDAKLDSASYTAASVVALLDAATIAAVTLAIDDKLLIRDTSSFDAIKTATIQSLSNVISSGSAGFLNYVSDADQTTTSGTYSDISGMSNQTSASLLAGTYLVTLFIDAYAFTGSGFARAQFRVNVDNDSLFAEMPSFDLQLSSGDANRVVGQATVVLTAGTHTFRPQWRMTAGSSAVGTNNGYNGQISFLKV